MLCPLWASVHNYVGRFLELAGREPLQDGGMAALPEPSEDMAYLPRVIRTLVQRRRSVKDLIKRESDPVRCQVEELCSCVGGVAPAGAECRWEMHSLACYVHLSQRHC